MIVWSEDRCVGSQPGRLQMHVGGYYAAVYPVEGEGWRVYVAHDEHRNARHKSYRPTVEEAQAAAVEIIATHAINLIAESVGVCAALGRSVAELDAMAGRMAAEITRQKGSDDE